MTGFLIWMAVAVAGTVALTYALHREFARLERERQAEALRAWMADSPAAAKLKRDYARMAQQIGEQLRPAMVRLTITVRDELTPKLQALAAAVQPPPRRRWWEWRP